jgi:hypothetical protein
LKGERSNWACSSKAVYVHVHVRVNDHGDESPIFSTRMSGFPFVDVVVLVLVDVGGFLI